MNYTREIHILSQDDLIQAGCFDIKTAINVCEEALIKYSAGDVYFPEKVSVVFDQETQDRINCLPAGFKSKNVYGMKWVSVFPENPTKRNVPNLSAVVLLSELTTGFPFAFMEATLCSNMRTAAMSTLAAKYLCNALPETIGFIGAGEQAKSHFLFMKTMFPSIKNCMVSSRTDASVDRFICQMKKHSPEVNFISCGNNYKKAVETADILITAISGQEKILQAEWIKDGAFYCHVGGLEDDFKVAQKASKIVCDDWSIVKHRTQTISQMYKLGLLSNSDIHANLYEIITKQKPGRENSKEIIYYNGVGLSYVDVALATWMYEKAKNCKVGKTVQLLDRSIFENQF